MFWTVQQTLIFPFLLLAGMLLPLDGAPGLAAGRLRPQPAHATSSTPSGRCSPGSYPADTVLAGFLAAAIVAALGVTVGVRTMRRSS